MRLISKLILSTITLACVIFYSCKQNELYNANDTIKYENLLKPISDRILGVENVRCYYDYHDALRASKKYKKPVFLLFNGITCRADRIFEIKVLGSKRVANYLKNDFIVAHLFCDAVKIPIAKDEQYTSSYMGLVDNLGKKNIDIEASKYNSNTQPYCIFMDENENLLAAEGYGYDPSPEKFRAHLDAVLERFRVSTLQ